MRNRPSNSVTPFSVITPNVQKKTSSVETYSFQRGKLASLYWILYYLLNCSLRSLIKPQICIVKRLVAALNCFATSCDVTGVSCETFSLIMFFICFQCKTA